MNVKIIGAGSIGNHLAQAARRMGWDVTVIDTDEKALERMRYEIYPQRYGAWDPNIKLYKAGMEPYGCYDIIFVGTPPDTRLKIIAEALKEKSRLLHLEKPLCPPVGEDLNKILTLNTYADGKTLFTVGYNHSVSPSISYVVSVLHKGILGEILTLDVEFREHWKGIFKAHPWLKGPEDSYLGYWKRGGGAGGEHSHALHLYLYISEFFNWGFPHSLQAMFSMKASYDQVMHMLLLAGEKGEEKIGRVTQDVVTDPPKKWLRAQGEKGFVEWHCNGHESGEKRGDLVRVEVDNMAKELSIFAKTRADDFYYEMEHYQELLDGKIAYKDSPLSFAYGHEVMNLLRFAYLSSGNFER